MKTRVLVMVTYLVVLCGSSLGEESGCLAINAMASMARAETMEALFKARRVSTGTYRAQLVSAYRAFGLRPEGKTEAQHLLALIPTNQDQRNAVITLGDALCDGETGADMSSLSRVRDGLAREWSKAVILAPQFMPRYVRFSLEAVADPHSDYAVQMKHVCERDHKRFLSGVKVLADDEARRFKTYVMEPDSCRAIALPEAE